MILLTSLYAWFTAHHSEVLKGAGGLYALLSVVNGLMKDSPEKKALGKFVDWLAIFTRSDASGTFKAPFHRKKHAATGTRLSLPLLPILVASSLLLSGCACWTPEHRNDKGCAVLHQIIDCSKDALLGGLSQAAKAIVGQYINGQASVDWDGLLASLEAAGIKDGGCILAQLENDFVSKPGGSPEHAARAHGVSQALQKFKADLGIEGVKFCFTLKGSAAKVCR